MRIMRAFCISFLIFINASEEITQSPERDNELYLYHRLDDTIIDVNKQTPMQLLPLDIRVSVNWYLEKKDIHSWMRSCKSNLASCRQHVRNLLCSKFEFLLNHNESRIDIKHLLNIPFVDPIVMNASMMPSYFGTRGGSKVSSKYIGIDSETGNGFLSFLIKKVQVECHQCRIITIVLNETNVHRIYYTHRFQSLFVLDAMESSSKSLSLDFKNHSDLGDIKGINTLLLDGHKQRMLLHDPYRWCLHEHWESCMFWLKVRNFFISCTRPMEISTEVYVCLAVSLALAAWILVFVFLCLTYI